MLTVTVDAQQITGIVFYDGDRDGIKDATEVGYHGITVRAYNSANGLVSSGTTAISTGAYTLAGLTAGQSYRIEYEVPEGFSASVLGTNSKTIIQFAAAGSTNVNLGIYVPSQICGDGEPRVVVGCGLFAGYPYCGVDPSAGGEITVASWMYNDRQAVGDATIGAHDEDLKYTNVGVPMGMGVKAGTQLVFMSTVASPVTAVFPNAPDGFGAIYVMNYSGPSKAFVNYKLLMKLTDIPGINMDPNNRPFFGEYGLGGLDLTEDGKTMYIVNMGERNLVRVDVSGVDYNNLPATAPTAANVTEIAIPNTFSCPNGVLRPGALKQYRGKFYVGCICDGSSGAAADLEAKVLCYDPNNGSWTEVLTWQPEAYNAGGIQAQGLTHRQWETPEDNSLFWLASNHSAYIYPFFVDIGFDDTGSMLLGILNKKLMNILSFWDTGYILRSFRNADGTFTLENNGASGPYSAGGPRNYNGADGPGGKWFFDQAIVNSTHNYTFAGGIWVPPGTQEVVSGAGDPISICAFGARYYNWTTGQIQGGKNLANAKISRVTGLDVICEEVPIEVGNRVWADVNNNGIQDPGEPGINDVTVQLKSANGDLLSTTTTSGNGDYIFTTSNVPDGDPVTPGNQPGLRPSTDYVICVPGAEFDPGNTLSKHILTLVNVVGSGLADESDNDATQQPNSDLVINFTTGITGQNDHAYDIGLVPPDWGDLPDTYKTTDVSGGPSHTITPNLKIGACVDGESSGQPDVMAGQMSGGDDFNSSLPVAGTCVGGDDEDGIEFITPLIPGEEACIRISVMNNTASNAYLKAWIDWDGSGAFDNGEEVNTGDFATTGFTIPNTGQYNGIVCFTVPSNATFGNGAAFARFRLSPTDNISFDGDGGWGEVEDYKVTLYKIGNIVWNDYNNNGQQNTNEVGINGVTVQLIYFGLDGVAGGSNANADITYTTTTSNMGTNGMYMFPALIPGAYKLSVPTAPPGGFLPTQLNVNPDATDADDPTGIMVMLPNVPNLPQNESGLGDVPNDLSYPDINNNLTFDFGYIQRDYGDLPDLYNTLSGNNGPSHVVSPLLKIGSCIDAEDNGNPETKAGKTTAGDDNSTGFGPTGNASNCGDDEDGIDYATVPLFIVTQQTLLDIPVMNTTGTTAKLTVFIDFNNNGSFGVGEMFSTTVNNNDPTAQVAIDVPGNAVVGQDLGFRIRLATDAAESMVATGPARTGEVEDYVIQVIGYDYGDLPDTYSTLEPNAPKHIISNNLKLGASVDAEIDGNPEAMAGQMTGGDDADPGLVTFGTSSPAGDDENGVMFVSPLIPGASATIMVDAMNMTGANATLQGWIDWNGDGDFDLPAEALVFTNANGGLVPSPAGLSGAKLTFNVPSTAVFAPGGAAFVRFRLSPAGNLAPDAQPDPVPFGEIEDYKVTLGKLGNLVFEDRNFNGQQDPGEPGIDGVNVSLTWLGPDGAIGGGDDVVYPTLTTGSTGFDPGEYYYCGLIDGPDQADNRYKLTYTTPANMTPTRDNEGPQQSDSDGSISGMNLSMAMETFEFLFPTPVTEQGTGDEGFPGVGNFPDDQTDETHDQGFAFLDYGDLPQTPPNDDFNTTMQENGAVHVITPNFKLGATVDAEQDGAPSANADGDGADEDGIVFATPLIPGNNASINVTAMNMTGTDATLQGWIDWNGNGILENTEELSFTNNGSVPSPLGVSNASFSFPVPSNATFNDGMVYARFRLSLTNGLSPDGPSKYDVSTVVPQGEVEDYKLNVAKIGNLVWEDRDFDGAQDAPADEPGINGVTVTLTWAGPNNTIDNGGDDVTYAVLSTGGPKGSGGNFDQGEYYYCGLINGTYKITYTTPTDMTPARSNQAGDNELDSDGLITGMDLTMAMETFTIANVTNLPTGETGNGDSGNTGVGGFPDGQTDETHDQGFAYLDYGDLPETGNGDDFNTTMAQGGAVHVVIPGFKLGASADGDRDGSPGTTADGDDLSDGSDDEDGVAFVTPLIPGNNATVSVTTMNSLANNALLQGWIDWDNSGTLDVGEALVFSNGGVVPTGTTNNASYTFAVPANAIFNDGMVYARFRLSPTGVIAADGPDKYNNNATVPQGEVEDYKLNVAKIGNLVWEDRNFNGTQDPTEPGLNNVEVTLVWGGANNDVGTGADDVTYIPIATGSGNLDDGEYYYCGLIPGEYKIIYTTPDYLTPTRTDQGDQTNGGDADSDGAITGMDLTMAMETFSITDVVALPTNENGTGDDSPNDSGTFPDNQTDETHDQGFACLDYGDLPESGNGDNFNSTMAEQGAVHVVTPGLSLGDHVDCERDAVPNTSANGDDNVDNTSNTCSKVPDGFISAGSLTCGLGTIVLSPGPDGRFSIAIYGNMSAWPQLQTAVANAGGINNAIGKTIYADVTNKTAVSYLGDVNALINCLAAAEGISVAAFSGGVAVMTGTTSTCAALETRNTDEDGIAFTTPLIPDNRACVEVSATNTTGADAVLQAWIDWDNSGTLDADEAIVFENGGTVPNGGVIQEEFCFTVPADAIFNDGMVFARFRLSPNGGLNADGPPKYDNSTTVPQGEVEDYKLNVGKIGNYIWEDFNFDGIQAAGEPAINNAEVTLVWAGANGVVGTGGDDVSYKPLVTGSGNFDDGEYYYCGLIPGTYKMIYTSPKDMTPTKPNEGNDDELDSDGTVTGMDVSMAMETFTINDVYALPTTENGIGDSGAPGVGTFPDNQTDETHDQGFAFIDYGDLPGIGYPGIFYQTKMDAGGPIHVVRPGFKIGASIDGERDATVLDATAQGDDVDALPDENGVVFPPNMVLAPGGSITVTVNVMNMTGAPATLQGWIDWDNDGEMDPTDEIIPIPVPIGGLSNQNVTLLIPANADFDMCMMYARFRLSTTGGLGPNGPGLFGPAPVPQGEVEDYKRAINTVPPVMTCPANIVKNNDPGRCGAVINYTTPLADDECTGWTLTLTQGQLSNTLFPIGKTVVEWKVTDLTGYMSSCSFSVTVNDTQFPTVTCPVNIVKWTAPGQCSAPIFFAVKGYTDNCAGLITPTITSTGHPAPGTSWPVGDYTVTYEVKDPSNNAAQCSFTVKVSDGQAPSISCPVNQTRNTDANVCTAVVNYAPVVTDNCPNATWAAVTPSHASGSAFAKGVTTVVLRATDAAGLTKTCTFRVTVNDRQAPSISCDASQSVNTGAGQCSAVVTYNDATFTDNCAPTSGTAVRISGLPSGAAFPKGVTNVVYKATDASGNFALCSVKITVTDNEKPKITCPTGPISRNTDAGKCGAAVSYSTPVSTDNCPGVQQQLLSGLASGSSFPVGSTVVRWQAKDAVGLTETCEFTVTVVDNQLPTISCPPNTTVMGGAAPCTIAKAQLPSATAQDNCGVTSLSSNAPASLPAGAMVVTWTAQDAANQQAQCQHTVTVMCQTGPNAGGGGNVLDLTTDGGLGLGLAPNPASESVLVTVAGIGGEGASLSVMDALGRTVWTRTLDMGTEQVVIDLTAQFAEGHYQVSLRTDSAVITKSLVVVKR